MAFGIQERKGFVVNCKRCRRDVPSGREEFPFQSITVECPLCGELRRYLPSEIFLGRPDQLITRQQRMFDPDAHMPRINRALVNLGACLIAAIRLAREIYNRVFRKMPEKIGGR